MTEPAVPEAITALIDDAVERARVAMARPYAPYSGFCAERNAVAHMIDAGERRIDAVAVVTGAAAPTPPCGACRQVLWEFGPESLVIAETTGGERLTWALEDLLPSAFGPNDLPR